MNQLDSLRSLAGAAGCLLLLALLSACRQGSPAPATQNAAQPAQSRATPTPEINKKEDRKVADHAYEKQSATPPAPDAVLYFIYNKDGDGATSYEIENGSVATYWYGHQFDLRGKHYFAGFAYSTPEKFGAAEDEPNPAPGSKVTLANATFVLSKPGTEKPWSLVGAEPYIGEFGAYEKGDEVDPKRTAVSYETEGGQFVLAVPTMSLARSPVISSIAGFQLSTVPVRSRVRMPSDERSTISASWRRSSTMTPRSSLFSMARAATAASAAITASSPSSNPSWPVRS